MNQVLDIPLLGGIILRRAGNDVKTNVPVRVVYHSPTGFEWGYGGSGPADLALNIVEAFLLEMKYEGPRQHVGLGKGKCFDLALCIYQDFKWEFIAGIPHEGAVLSYRAISRWISDKIKEVGQWQEPILVTE